MHPSRLVGTGLFFVSILTVFQVVISGEFTQSFGAKVRLVGGVTLLAGSLSSIFQYEKNPIVTEYGPKAYAFLFGILLWSLGLTLEL